MKGRELEVVAANAARLARKRSRMYKKRRPSTSRVLLDVRSSKPTGDAAATRFAAASSNELDGPSELPAEGQGGDRDDGRSSVPADSSSSSSDSDSDTDSPGIAVSACNTATSALPLLAQPPGSVPSRPSGMSGVFSLRSMADDEGDKEAASPKSARLLQGNHGALRSGRPLQSPAARRPVTGSRRVARPRLDAAVDAAPLTDVMPPLEDNDASEGTSSSANRHRLPTAPSADLVLPPSSSSSIAAPGPGPAGPAAAALALAARLRADLIAMSTRLVHVERLSSQLQEAWQQQDPAAAAAARSAAAAALTASRAAAAVADAAGEREAARRLAEAEALRLAAKVSRLAEASAKEAAHARRDAEASASAAADAVECAAATERAAEGAAARVRALEAEIAELTAEGPC